MPHLLHIDSSPRGERSHSRIMSREFVDAWKAAHSDGTVTYRDLGHNPVPHINEAWIAGPYTPAEYRTPEMVEALALSDGLIDELRAADTYVFGVPMHNLSIPSTLKAYIDQIVRYGETFTMENGGAKGLLTGKKAVVVTARGFGGYAPGDYAAAVNFQDTYLRAVLGFVGITDVQFIHMSDLNSGDDARTEILAKAREQIASIAPTI